MRPLLPSLIMVAYVYFSFVRNLPWHPFVKRLITLLLLAIGLKYVFYVLASDLHSVPDVPRWVLQSMEVGYTTVLLLFVLLVIRDATSWLWRRIQSVEHVQRRPFSRTAVGGALAGLALCVAIWGTGEATRVPEVRTHEIVIPNLPAALDGLVIVQLSDIHIGPLLDKGWLRAVVEKTNEQSPDIVVITGDLIDGYLHALASSVAPLADLRAKYGVYGVTGNHEYYFNAPEWLPVFAQLGIRMLANEHHTLTIKGATVVMAGVNDVTSPDFDPQAASEQALRGAPETVRILLRHRGDRSLNTVQLQLSGHTHGGLVFFMRPLVALLNGGCVGGLYTLPQGEQQGPGQLYVSPGTGVGNSFACRIGVPSEISRLVLRAAVQAE